MIRLLTVVGARPQIIKAAALSRAIRQHFPDTFNDCILHTGQHYDRNMSQIFFDELNIPQPDINLGIGSGTHGRQTAGMIEGIEKILLELSPDFVILYGDTNSTLAGALASAKLGIDVIHIEAGLRSFNKKMPEEINRIACDHVSTLLFSPTLTGINNLVREGFSRQSKPPYTIDNPAIFHCGDVMYDNSLYFSALAENRPGILTMHKLVPGHYILGTIHRDSNTDDPSRLTSIFEAFQAIAEIHKITIFLPLHPRTKKLLKKNLPESLLTAIQKNSSIKIVEPVSFLDMILLEKNARLIITDSGGVQKEAFFFKKPSIVLRPQTEWTEIIENGAAILADTDGSKIKYAFEYFENQITNNFPPVFGDGNAANFICEKIIETYNYKNTQKK